MTSLLPPTAPTTIPAEAPAVPTEAPAIPAPGRTMVLGGRAYPLILPSLRDPRLHLAAVIVSLQVLGQTVLHFELSVAQILVSILTSAVLEVGLTFWRRKVVMWPASALLTGNGVSFILRVPGTVAGDWWSLRGAWLFALAAAVSLLSKYVIRRGERHLFNPSNLGLVAVFLAFGTRVVNPQDLWWGPMSPGLVVTLAVILVGGLTIVRRLHLLGMVAAFWVSFAALAGVLAGYGHCMTARWHVGPVCGQSFFGVLPLSPEIFVFMFFMITDPRTSPSGRVARVAYGAGVGYLAALLVAPAQTEFWTKVGVLGALVVVCGLRPLLERRLPAAGSDQDQGWWLATALAGSRRRLVRSLGLAVACLAVLLAAGVPARRAAATPVVVPTGPVVRPAVAVAPGDLPPVHIDASVARIQVAMTPALAQQMASDLLADLIIEGDAIRSHSEALAATAATGRELGIVQHQVDVATAGGPAGVPGHSFASLSVVSVKDPLRPQDPARLGIAVPGGRIYALTLVGDHYLIALQVSP